MLELKSNPERINTTFSMKKKLRNVFYHTLIKKYGCTRNHVGESIDEAIELWIKKTEQELELNNNGDS